MTRLSAREPIQATSPLLQHGFISRPGLLQGDDRCGPEAAVSSGPRRRGFTAKLQESADHQSRKRKRGLSFGPGLAQGASGVKELVGEGRWLCGFVSCSLDCEGPTVPRSLGPGVWSRYLMYFCTQAWPGSAQIDRPFLVWKLRSKKEKMRNGESAGKEESVAPPQPLPRPPPAAASCVTPIKH